MSERKPRVPWWERLNRALFPHMGPAQLGPFGQPPPEPSEGKPCPLCGATMSAHVIERSADRNVAARLYCPAPTTAVPDGTADSTVSPAARG